MRARPRDLSIIRRSLWILVGIAVIVFDIAITNWTLLTLPQDIGILLWTGIMTLGFIIIIFSSSLARVTPPPLSKIHAEQIDRWEKSGNVATVLSDVPWTEAQRILTFTRRHFGKYVTKTVTVQRGHTWIKFPRLGSEITWSIKAPRVGSKILPTRLSGNEPLFSLILYRRDLARLKGIRRPWRTISPRDSTPEIIRNHDLIELPNWMS